MIKSRSLLFALLPAFLLFFISLGMVISEKACIEWYGFGIDSNNYVYIGTASEIEVYDDQKLVRTIDIPHYRTYYFTLENDDTIILSDSISVYKMDNLGNVVEKYPDKNCEKYNELQHQRVVLTSGGSVINSMDLYGAIRLLTNMILCCTRCQYLIIQLKLR